MIINSVTENSIIKEMLLYGFFSEYLPHSFTTKKLVDSLEIIKGNLGYKNIKTTIPTNFSIHKDGNNRRTIGIPNILSYLECSKFIEDEWNFLLESSLSINSNSPIFIIESYDEGENENVLKNITYKYLNSEILRDSLNKKSTFIEAIKENINISAGCLYKLNLDINNFYNSIYTHSIAWVICGKVDAKKLSKKSKSEMSGIEIDENIKNDYKKSDIFDELIRKMKNNETNGILTGPFTSRIFSELILAKIDKELRIEGYIFRRYVDDYSIYFRNKHDIDIAINKIEMILSEYNLYINHSKTIIEEYPFNVIIDLKKEFEIAESKDGILGILNKAMKLYKEGEKGAIKYALKMIRNKKIQNTDQIDNIFSILINLVIALPKNGKYIIDFLTSKENKYLFNKVKPEEVINQELDKCINENKEHETVIYLELLRKLNAKLTKNNFEKILKSRNDLGIIISLYFYSQGKQFLQGEDDEKNLVVNEFIQNLRGEDYFGERWLLLYEIKVNKYIRDVGNLYDFENNPNKITNFFKLMEKNNVRFYIPN